jgi:hypothetical protein
VAHSVATRVAFETLKARIISAPVLPILKSGQDAEFVVATDASNVGIVGVLLQEDSEGQLRPCAYWARKLKDVETRYSAYDREAYMTGANGQSTCLGTHRLGFDFRWRIS